MIICKRVECIYNEIDPEKSIDEGPCVNDEVDLCYPECTSLELDTLPESEEEDGGC